jgi:5-methylcytosine-specific restriction endonuclease McrA
MRFARYSKVLTEEARASKRFLDKRSKIGLKPDGSQFVKLYGLDMSLQRSRVWEMSGALCAKCGECIDWEDSEMHHKTSRGKGGDDSILNLEMLCRNCHRGNHVQVLSGKR